VYPLLATRLREALPSLATDINTAVGQEVAEYSRPIEGVFGRNRRFYVELGRGELRQGRGLDALLSAYRVGARVAWRTVGDLAVDAGASPAALVELAELLFTYIDGLSGLSVRGYAEEQAARAGERDRRRAELARLLVTGIDEETLRELAVLARWPLPEHLVAVILPAQAPADPLPSDALIWPRDDDVVALVPCSADFGLAQLRTRLKEVPAVVGSLVSPRDVRQSLAAAEALAMIALTGDRRHAGPILVDDHLLDLVLRADEALLERLSRQLLAPLDAVPASARERLAVTLLAWLAHAGARNAVALALHVHPQTVRYRMTQLREAFGDVLEDPERRTALTVVLRAAYGPVPGAGLQPVPASTPS
jgi:hypothetical protein